MGSMHQVNYGNYKMEDTVLRRFKSVYPHHLGSLCLTLLGGIVKPAMVFGSFYIQYTMVAV